MSQLDSWYIGYRHPILWGGRLRPSEVTESDQGSLEVRMGFCQSVQEMFARTESVGRVCCRAWRLNPRGTCW